MANIVIERATITKAWVANILCRKRSTNSEQFAVFIFGSVLWKRVQNLTPLSPSPNPPPPSRTLCRFP